MFYINILIATGSYFVYGMSIEPVLCSIIYAFLTSTVCSKVRASQKEIVKFEIITQDAEQLCVDITGKLHQRATVIDARGAYSGQITKVVICAAKKEAVPYIEELLLSYNGSVVFKSIIDNSVSGILYK